MKNRFLFVLLAPLALSFVGATNAPTISTQPQSASVLVGTPAVFTVEAAGEDLTYQWTRNGTDILGANTAAFVLPTAALSDSTAGFEVKVTNDKGVVVSCRAVLTVIETGQPSTSPPICPQPANGGGGCGGDDNGGGGGGSSSSSSSSSSGSSGNPPDNGLPPEFQTYPVTEWKGTVKATTKHAFGNDSYTMVVEGDVVFTSQDGERGLFPQSIRAASGNLTVTRDGNTGGCVDTVRGSGTILAGEGYLQFTPDPPPPQHASQLKYQGNGSSNLTGTQTRACSSGTTINGDWIERPAWLLVGMPDETTSPDLLVISGTKVFDSGTGAVTTFEWNLVKQH